MAIVPAGVVASIALVFLSILLLKANTNRGLETIETVPPVAGAVTALAVPTVFQAEVVTAPTSASPSVQSLTDAREDAPNLENTASRPGPSEDRRSTPTAITNLADGSSEAILTYPEPGQRYIYVKVPLDWDVSSALMDLSGEAYTVEQLDQKNEAYKFEGTWGVRAQQFRPMGKVLTSVGLYLVHTSSKPGDLAVDIREDNGNGYPSVEVLTSVSKPVSVGGYRWEVFDFPDVEVEPGRLYWIVNYVKPLEQIVYPTTPSVGDYGYYIGMSTADEYPKGDSADFLTFARGSGWEKYGSRKAWDLMFRVNSLVEYFPTGARLDAGGDGAVEWRYPGEFQGADVTVDLSSAMRDFSHAQRDVAEGDILVPLLIGSDSPGVIRVSNVRIVGTTSP